MKAIFFDTDDITLEYLVGANIEGLSPVFLETTLSTEADIDFDKIKDAEIISVFVHSMDVNAELLSKFPNLKLVSTRSTGYNHIDLKYCKEHNITVCNTPAYGRATVPEFTFGLMLDLVKKISLSAREFREKEPNIDKYMGFDLEGKSLGVIGTGAIGQHTIKIACGFGMKVLAYDPYPSDYVKELPNARYVKLDELYNQSDIISLHAPSTKENFHMISKDAFDKMKRGVIIINTARGDLIDTAALYQNLMSGKVGGAGLDVMEFESFFIHDEAYTKTAHDFDQTEMFNSLLNMKIMQQENVIVTPHIAFNSIDAIHRILDITIENINEFLNGNIVNSVMK